ncbi:MAG: exosortase, partial [Desulfuromonadaceae bacterium]|nr:exosortase [Desulfuromonadaceae bacterium]
MVEAQSTAVKPYNHWSMVKLFVALFVFNAAFFPVWKSLVDAWSSSEDYSHGFLIVPLAVYILWRKRQELARMDGEGNWSGLTWLSGALVLYLIAQVGGIATLASLSMVAAAFSGVFFLYGGQILRIVGPPLCFLLFAIPLPAQFLALMTIPLQLFVTKATVLLASWSGIPIYHEGN